MMDLLVDFPSRPCPSLDAVTDDESTVCSSMYPVGDMIVDFPVRLSDKSALDAALDAVATLDEAASFTDTKVVKSEPKRSLYKSVSERFLPSTGKQPATGHTKTKRSRSLGVSKSVSFDYRPPQINLFDKVVAEDKADVWYNESDLVEMAREKERHVTMMRTLARFGGKQDDNDTTMAQYAQLRLEKANTTPMGLENYLGGGTWMVAWMKRREAHSRAVLDEQWNIWQEEEEEHGAQESGAMMGVDGQDRIAEVSREMSQWGRDRAQDIGALQGEEDCRKILYYSSEQRKVTLGVRKGYGPSLPTPPSA